MEICNGRILRIDLSNGGCVNEIGSLGDYTPFLGGRGVNQALLFQHLPLGVSPFDPPCPVAIGAGLLCGTNAPGASRLSLDTLNPFTGGIASSNVGGNVAAALRHAGIGNFLVVGQAEHPVSLLIDDGHIELRDATDLWGSSVTKTDRALRNVHGEDVQTLVIGPAAEQRVWAASVFANGARAAGRCGIGAVLGAKQLKAIVVRGSGLVEVAQPDKFQQAIGRCLEKLQKSTFNQRRMRYGVYCYEVPWEVESPYRNFSGEPIPERKKAQFHPDRFLPYLTAQRGCEGCPIRCWTTHTFTDTDGTVWKTHALQGNDPDNFGAKLDLDDPRNILKAHSMCNDLGLDVDVTSNVIAWAIACFRDGLLKRSETAGRELTWGDAPLVFDLIQAIAYRDGLGDLLAEGCARASQRLGRGSRKHCHHVRGNDLFECLWQSPAWAFGTVLSPRGGTHTRGAVLEERLQGLPAKLAMRWYGLSAIPERGSDIGVEKLVIHQERLNAALDCLGICSFTTSGRPDMLLPEDYANLTAAAIGEPIDQTALLLIGERVHTQERCFNWLRGLPGREGDLPPRHFVDTPLAGRYRVDPDTWNRLLDRYYDQHGWNRETGWPIENTLATLELEVVAERLREAGYIATPLKWTR